MKLHKAVFLTVVILLSGPALIGKAVSQAWDNYRLPPLARVVRERTPYGELELVDEIRCWETPTVDPMNLGEDPHPYMDEGRVRVKEIRLKGGKLKFRVAGDDGSHSSIFYRIGRRLDENTLYLIEIQFPQDVSREYCVQIFGSQGKTNYPSVMAGWHTGECGCREDQRSRCERNNFPLDGTLGRWYSTVAPCRATLNGGDFRNGVWIGIIARGRKLVPLSHGVAVHRIRLYRVCDLNEPIPSPVEFVPLPPDLPRRFVTTHGETDVRYRHIRNCFKSAALAGFNCMSPNILKWNAKACFPSEHYPSPPTWPQNWPIYYRNCLAIAKDMDMYLIPRIEYGGSPKLKPEGHAVTLDGEDYRSSWGGIPKNQILADLAAPETLADFLAVLDEMVLPFAGDYPGTLRGFLWRYGRGGDFPVSYSDRNIRAFADDAGIPKLTRERLRRDKKLRERFVAWWYERAREVFVAVSKHFDEYNRIFGTDMKLYIMQGGDNMPFSWYKSRDRLRRPWPDLSKLPYESYDWDAIRLAGGLSNVVLVATTTQVYLSRRGDYFAKHDGPDGIGVCKWYDYIEKGASRYCRKIVNYTEHPGPFALEEYAITMATHDFFLATMHTMMYFEEGFPQYSRPFWAAYRALPAMESQVVPVASDREIVVRRYATKYGDYYGVINPTAEGRTFDVDFGAPVVRDLVSGERLRTDRGRIRLIMGPMSLKAFLVSETE